VALVISALLLCIAVWSTHAAEPNLAGLWVHQTTLSSSDAIDRLVQDAADAGFTTLLVEIPARRGPVLSGRVRTLLAAAHGRSLRVHAWVQITRVTIAGDLPTARDHLVHRHPEWLMVPRALAAELARTDIHSPAYVGTLDRWALQHPDEVEGLYLSPISAEAAIDAAARLAVLLTEHPFDGVHLDSAQFPSSDFDYGRDAVTSFRDDVTPSLTEEERRRLDARAVIDPLTYPDAFPTHWSRFRRSRVTALVARFATLVRRLRPAAQVSVSVVADPDEAFGRRLQDWRAWAEIGFIDIACLRPSIETADDFERQLHSARRFAGLAELWAGVGARWLSPAETFDRIRTVQRSGADGIMIWSYESVTDPAQHPPGHLQEIGRVAATVIVR